jgi:uncharacterized protein (DUF2249 family)
MTKQIVELDVRDILRAKQEPFEQIMGAVQTLAHDDVLELHATFRPDPLLKVLGKQGFHYSSVEKEPEHVIVQFYREAGERPIFHMDNRGLEPPLPMVRALEFLDQDARCQEGTLDLEIWNERVPALLLPELTERSFLYQVTDDESGTVTVKIRKDK